MRRRPNLAIDTDVLSAGIRRPNVRRSFLRWTARCAAWLFALAIFAATNQHAFAAGPPGKVVFYLGNTGPVVRLERIPQSEGVRAILAMYTLENGAGCAGKNARGLVECALTKELGLGANCSEEHIGFVRGWFNRTSNLSSRWGKEDEDAKRPGALEGLCYSQPYTASWQNIWETIRVDINADVVTVDAIFSGGSQNGRTRTRYVTSYRIGPHEISELASDIHVLERSQKSFFSGR